MTLPTGSAIVGLCLFSILLSAGQILFKITATSVPNIDAPLKVLYIATSPYAWLALLLYGCATVLWVVLLQRVPLSHAYPFVALGFVLVPLAASIVFNETISARYVLGVVLILAGIYMTYTPTLR